MAVQEAFSASCSRKAGSGSTSLALMSYDIKLRSILKIWRKKTMGIPKEDFEAATRIIGTMKKPLAHFMLCANSAKRPPVHAINNINVLRKLAGRHGDGIY
jgi:hypothetical protein